MQRIQPKIKDIQTKHKDDRDQQAKALMELYKEHGVNPFSGILLLIIQIPILLTFYWVIRSGIGTAQLTGLYSFRHGAAAHQYDLPRLHRSCKAELHSYPRRRARAISPGEACHLSRAGRTAGTLSQAEKIARQMVFVVLSSPSSCSITSPPRSAYTG